MGHSNCSNDWEISLTRRKFMMTKNREEFKREKELEEARKAGIAPAAIDADGNEINPHIPQYMTKGLWYLNQEGVSSTLMHQKKWKWGKTEHLHWYDRGAKSFQAFNYRKGACDNCGSITHQSKDCLERPRKIGAKFSGKCIAADDKIQELNLSSFEAKRDRWNGYDTKEYSKLVQINEKIGDQKRNNKLYSYQDDEDKIGDNEQANFDKVEKRVNTVAGGATGTIRNLRIREDIAKYLINLDLDSAYYDPKSRSMREDPHPDKPFHEKYYSGDNHIKKTGEDFRNFHDLLLHQISASEKGFAMIANATPSQADALLREYILKKEKLRLIKRFQLLTNYGTSIDEYSRDFEVMLENESLGKANKNKKKRPMYSEDFFINNHTTIWGSYWKDGYWGYACCRSFTKNCRCCAYENTSTLLV